MSVTRTALRLLPHDIARTVSRVLNPERHARFERLLAHDATSENDRSFKPLREKKCIFVHIPKCGGLSLGAAIFGCTTGRHMSIHEYKLVFPRREFDEMFKFTFVRNPWDRLASAYFFLKKGGISQADRNLAAEAVEPYATFDDFVQGYVDKDEAPRALHMIPQYRFLCYGQNDAPGVDFIGRLETVEEDFNRLSEKLGVNATLRKTNASSAKPADYRKIYSPQSVDIVGRVYQRDVSLFDYRFE